MGEFLAENCPADCPFRSTMTKNYKLWFCSYALYASYFDPNRGTRTTIDENGRVDYHTPPNCDIYPRFKHSHSELEKLRRKLRDRKIATQSDYDRECIVTAEKHKAISMRHKKG